jgi:hypothetical protein
MNIYTSDQANPTGTPGGTCSILQALRLVCLPDCVYELRCLGYTLNGKWPATVSGYYDDLEQLARDAAIYNGHCKGVYITLNPVVESLKARSYNRVREGVKDDDTTKDKHIARRAWLPLDFDPDRESGISSTAAEHEAALERARQCREWLREQGLPDPILADSGNGGHLLYRIDLPNDDAAGQLVADFLKAVAARFPDGGVNVDTGIFNPSRIWKLYGTMACKGDNIAERPHRKSCTLEVPSTMLCTPPELIERIARPSEPAEPSGSATERTAMASPRLASTSVVEVPGWLARHDLVVAKSAPYKDGHKWVLRCCPFNPEHKGGCAVVTQRADGKIGFRCLHNSCNGKGWKAVLAHFGETAGRTKKSLAERLKSLALENAELFTTPDGTAHALVAGYGRRECYKIASTPFRRWVAGLAEDKGLTPNKTAVSDAVFAIEARAFRDGPKKAVYLRLARVDDRIYVDLADHAGRVVEISADGWRTTTDCPVAFVRHENMAPLPVPERGGSFGDLRPFLNVTEAEFPLVRGFILDCFKAVGPYTVLLINGEQGSAKSTATKILRQIIDPVHKALARRLQRDEYELAIAAQRNAVLFFDNVSSLPQWLSDAIASLATGSGFAVRTLYSQDEETVYGNAVPVCFNGIPDFAESSDLLDRAIRVTLPRIADERRLSEDQFEPAFQAARPRILGAILDAVSAGLRNFETVQLGSLPRMARSARWIAACELALPAGQWSFAEAYERNREELNVLAIDHSPVATALLSWMDQTAIRTGKPWEGSASALHTELLGVVNGLVAMSVGFPKAPNKLSSELRRLAPALSKVGVRVSLGRSKHGSKVTVERLESRQTVPPATAASAPEAPSEPVAALRLLPKSHGGIDGMSRHGHDPAALGVLLAAAG